MNEIACSVCHTQVRATDYFCFNCGANLKPKPKSVDALAQVYLYLGSFFLPPMGYIWGARYLKESDQKAKVVGIIAMVITTVSLVLTIVAVKQLSDMINSQVSSGVMNLLGN
jgi:hypothetical protein